MRSRPFLLGLLLFVFAYHYVMFIVFTHHFFRTSPQLRSKTKHFDREPHPPHPSKLSIWDIPPTENYVNWRHTTHPVSWKQTLTDVNTPPYNKRLAGLHELSRIEIEQVVSLVASRVELQLSNMSVLSMSRRIDRLHGVTYNTVVSGLSPTSATSSLSSSPTDPSPATVIASLQLERKFQPLQITHYQDLHTKPPIVWIVVATQNRTPQLRRLITSIEKMVTQAFVGLIVVDQASTDENTRQVVGSSSLVHKKYLFAPRNAFQFSRSILLNHGIQSIDSNDVLFTADVDVSLPANLYAIVLSSVRQGQQIYAPIITVEKKRKKRMGFGIAGGAGTETVPTLLPWGFGIFGAYASDYIKVQGYDTNTFKYGWGGEDIHLITQFIQHGYTVSRPPEPGIIHRWHATNQWHPKKRKENKDDKDNKDGKKHCLFDWKKGEWCESIYDTVNIDFDRIWPIAMVLPVVHCTTMDIVQNYSALSVDLPPGTYLVSMSASTNANANAVFDNDEHHQIKLKVTQTSSTQITGSENKASPLLSFSMPHQLNVFDIKQLSTIQVWVETVKHCPAFKKTKKRLSVAEQTIKEMDQSKQNREMVVLLRELRNGAVSPLLPNKMLVAAPHHCATPNNRRAAMSLGVGKYDVSVKRWSGKFIQSQCTLQSFSAPVKVRERWVLDDVSSTFTIEVASSSVLFCNVESMVCKNESTVGVVQVNVKQVL